MGEIMKVIVKISNVEKPDRCKFVQLIYDTGAQVSVISSGLLKDLDVKPQGEIKVTGITGNSEMREFGVIKYEMKGKSGTSPVIFGKIGDMSVLGTSAMEVLGLKPKV